MSCWVDVSSDGSMTRTNLFRSRFTALSNLIANRPRAMICIIEISLLVSSTYSLPGIPACAIKMRFKGGETVNVPQTSFIDKKKFHNTNFEIFFTTFSNHQNRLDSVFLKTNCLHRSCAKSLTTSLNSSFPLDYGIIKRQPQHHHRGMCYAGAKARPKPVNIQK